ncbi:MAG: 4Fe-4S binding protein [Candidatus Aenigmarchaeota archaeon]|nr:4Fe-4S binding protein [Candidatus Aenigmarchaeota archaeon]
MDKYPEFPKEKHVKKKAGWKEIPIGGMITKAGSSLLNKTGTWRAFRPIKDDSKCIHCFMCYVHCPENAIRSDGEKVKDIDLDYCKGCGICARICPVKAITMKEEAEFNE